MSEPHRLNSPAKRGTQAPNGSVLTYGFVACCLALTGLLALAGFYDIDLKPQGLAIIALGVLAFTSGVFLHFRRTARNRAAHVQASFVSPALHDKEF